ncbi:hypothetical protein BJ165DRAFT_1493521, partial [Panaeolus papilionaceus]
MWKNMIETNSIMVGTHADSLIAEAVLKLGGVDGHVDLDLAWEAVWKDATVPPESDCQWEVRYEDRENVDYEVHAGLSSVCDTHGWVADDVRSESPSRTLDYVSESPLPQADTPTHKTTHHRWSRSPLPSPSHPHTHTPTDNNYAAYILACELNKSEETMSFLLEISFMAPYTLFHDETGFMAATSKHAGWAGDQNGWTEGD